MLLKDSIEQAFGYDAEERIFHFLVKDELSDCGGDTARWLRLFEKCETWRKQFLLWENGTYINYKWRAWVESGNKYLQLSPSYGRT